MRLPGCEQGHILVWFTTRARKPRDRLRAVQTAGAVILDNHGNARSAGSRPRCAQVSERPRNSGSRATGYVANLQHVKIQLQA